MLFSGTTENGRFIFTGKLKYHSDELAGRDDTFLADIIRLLDDSSCSLDGFNDEGTLFYSYSSILNLDEVSGEALLSSLIGVGERLDKMIQSETIRRSRVPLPLVSLDLLDSTFHEAFLIFDSNLRVLKVSDRFEETVGFRFLIKNSPVASVVPNPELVELIISLKEQLEKRGVASGVICFVDQYRVYCLDLPTEEKNYMVILRKHITD